MLDHTDALRRELVETTRREQDELERLLNMRISEEEVVHSLRKERNRLLTEVENSHVELCHLKENTLKMMQICTSLKTSCSTGGDYFNDDNKTKMTTDFCVGGSGTRTTGVRDAEGTKNAGICSTTIAKPRQGPPRHRGRKELKADEFDPSSSSAEHINPDVPTEQDRRHSAPVMQTK
ncbi:unnamed protein product [Amoebophrya sp. A120]|nr:unnamed protein product [Amoebophrya sp. A120]|eukprot:GSA120T00011245001.1